MTADEILRVHAGAQVIGGPGAGKSSLLRHITHRAVSQWLEGQGVDFVPVLVHASALAGRKPLDDHDARRIRRTPILGGLINEYTRAA